MPRSIWRAKSHVATRLAGTGSEVARIGYVAVTRSRDLLWRGVLSSTLAELRPVLLDYDFQEKASRATAETPGLGVATPQGAAPPWAAMDISYAFSTSATTRNRSQGRTPSASHSVANRRCACLHQANATFALTEQGLGRNAKASTRTLRTFRAGGHFVAK